jgi:hypothetical protein
MSKPRLGADPFFSEQTERVIQTLTDHKPPAHRAKQKAGAVKSIEKGLPAGWTRASFIIRKDTLERLKDYAYTERILIKEVITEAIEAHIKGTKTLKRS